MIKLNNNTIYPVMYHYIVGKENQIFPDLKGISLDNFKKQINYFKKNCNILSQDDFLEILEKKKIPNKPSIILTFDDGYIDHYNHAYPYLSKYKLSGIFYPPVNSTKATIILDVNKIHFILQREKNIKNILKLIIKFYELYTKKKFTSINIRSINLKSRFDNEETILVKRLLQFVLPEKIRNKIVDKIYKILVDIPEKELVKKIYMNKKHIIEMKKDNMSFGLHGVTHRWWSKLSNQDQEFEISESINYLDKMGVLGKNFSASYPNGAFKKSTLSILENKKIAFAFTTKPNGITKRNIKNNLLLPRFDTNDFNSKIKLS